MSAVMQRLPALAPTLASLAAPLAAPEFLARHWKRSVFHAPGSAERLAPLFEEMGSAELDALIARSAQLAVLGVEDDRSFSHAEAIVSHAERGATLYFRMREDFPLCRWALALAAELGEPPLGVTSFFAVRGGGGTRAHLDWNENFTLQLRGAKRWHVAPEPAAFVRNPVTNWTIGDPAPLHADAARAPSALPEDAVSYLLTPGSVLYVPRGHLHHVTSVDAGDSLSLNLSFPPTPWGLILSTLLGARLLEHPEFREGLTGAFGSAWGREEVLARLPRMLEAFAREAEALGGDLRAVLDDPARLREYLAKRGYPRI